MLYSDQLIFLHLQKTGGNHVGKLLGRYMPMHKASKHAGLARGFERPFVLMGIRNPWDWYVSLWAYGCQREGALYDYLTSGRGDNVAYLAARHGGRPREWRDWAGHLARLPGKDRALWRNLYRDAEDAERFRLWLRHIHEWPGNGHTGEEFSALPLRGENGLMTARYLKVCSRDDDWHTHRRSLITPDDALGFAENFGAPTHYLRTESLERDLAIALTDMGHTASADELRSGKTNPSKHHGAGYYYDAETAELVAQRDRTIIARHSYSFPED